MSDSNAVIDQFFGDATTPITWASEEEKRLHFWLDDLHCPQPISPMWFDIGGWWLTCDYMYRRFGVPFGKDWVAKTVQEYVLSAVVPRDPKEAAELGPYFNMVMPIYADKFLGWWKRRYLPEILHNFEYLDTFPMKESSLPERMEPRFADSLLSPLPKGASFIWSRALERVVRSLPTTIMASGVGQKAKDSPFCYEKVCRSNPARRKRSSGVLRL